MEFIDLKVLKLSKKIKDNWERGWHSASWLGTTEQPTAIGIIRCRDLLLLVLWVVAEIGWIKKPCCIALECLEVVR